MKCLSCKENFHPQMYNLWMGINSKNQYVHLYYQMCPNCKNPIIGIKESNKVMEFSVDTDDVKLLGSKPQG